MRAQFNRWPHIARFLHIDEQTGRIDHDYLGFVCDVDDLPPAIRAAAYEEWADFHEWHLAQRSAELADDPLRRHLVAEWTDSVAYSCRRNAAFARGEDPGPRTPQPIRRPDLYTT